VVTEITTLEQFESILDKAGSSLLVFDLYADWCMPCRILSPMLKTVAEENRDKAAVYKINVDKLPALANAFGVSGIPFVVFVKNKTAVHALTGVQAKDTYVRAIEQFGESSGQESMKADGKLENGIRKISMVAQASPGNIYVYRGEVVELTITKLSNPYSIHIPEYKVSAEASAGEDLTVSFKAKDVGVFPIYCNGKCPAGDGANLGQIVVMQYKSDGAGRFTELSAADAKAFMEKEGPLLLDVRTPNEYYSGHLKGALLIPLQQLEGRLSEIDKYRDKKVLVYCRSGNRSTVAAQILIRNGFSEIANLRPGIIGWVKEGYEVVK